MNRERKRMIARANGNRHREKTVVRVSPPGIRDHERRTRAGDQERSSSGFRSKEFLETDLSDANLQARRTSAHCATRYRDCFSRILDSLPTIPSVEARTGS
jgi:hypothetical protein